MNEDHEIPTDDVPLKAPAPAAKVAIVMLDYGAVRRVGQAEVDRLIAESKARLATAQDIAIGG